MPQTIKLKRSATAGQVPTTAQLDLGEVAINTADGKFFIRKNDGTTDVVMELSATIAGTASSTSAGASAPTDPAPSEGDLWFDTANDKLKYFDGAAWVEVGSDLSSLDVTGDVTLGDSAGDTLTVNASADFNGPVNIDGALTTTGTGTFGTAAVDTQTFNGNVDMNNNLNVDGATTVDELTVDGNLVTTANSTFGNAASDTHAFNGNVDMNNDLNVDGALTTTGTGTFGNASGDTQTFNGNVDMNNNLNVDGTADFNGNVDLGDATSDTITATGRFDSALVPSTNKTHDLGTTALRWDDIYADSIDLDSNLVVDGNTTLGNAATDTLTVNADTTFNDDVSISGITANEVVYADTNNDLTGSGNFTYNGTTMTLAGPAVFNGNVDLGNATSDTITATGRFDSAVTPSTDNSRDLGTTSLRWQDLHAVRVNGLVNSIRIESTAPTTRQDGTALAEGDIYYNTVDDAINTYDGTTWNPISGGATISDTEPTTKIDGMLWQDTTNGGMYTWYQTGGTWIGVTNLGA